MKKLNKNGSVLISVVTIVLLILIIFSIIFAVANSYQKRAINEHARKQAYLNGVSIAESIAGQIYSGNSDFIPTDNQIEFDDKNITLPTGYGGKVSAIIKYKSANEKDVLYIQVTSTYSNQVEKLQLSMKKQNEKWYKTVYSKIGDVLDD